MQKSLFKRKNEDKGKSEWIFDILDEAEIRHKHMNNIQKVKQKLWRVNYRVEDYSDKEIFKFHLLVERKYRVAVGERMPIGFNWKDVDVYAMVDENGVTFWQMNQGQLKNNKSPYDVFGRKNNGKKTTKKSNKVAKE